MLAAGGKAPSLNGLEKLYGVALIWRFRTTCIENGYAFFAPANDPTVWRSGWYLRWLKCRGQAR